MLLGLYGFLYSLTVTLISGLELTHQDLEKPNEKICSPRGSCTSKSLAYQNFTSRNCMCDHECIEYGDCCLDSKYFDQAVQRRAISSFSCVIIKDDTKVYIKQTCSPSWTIKEVRVKCQNSTNSDSRQPLLRTPVTNLRSNITYGNIFCAKCNYDAARPEDIKFWKQDLDCNFEDDNEQEFEEKNLSYNESDGGHWQVFYKNKTYPCELRASVPETLISRVRQCVPWIKTCPATWNKSDIRDRCDSYTLAVYTNVSYRNVHCAICNNVPVQDLDCQESAITSRFPIVVPSPSFSILFDFTGGNSVGKIRPCRHGQLYDHFFKQCLELINDEPSLVLLPDGSETYHRVLPLGMVDCTRITLNETDYVLMDDVIYVPRYNQTYDRNHYLPDKFSGSIQICSHEFLMEYVSKYKPYFNVLTMIGIGVSVVCLFLHLLVFTLVDELRNLSGKNLASMCVALVIGYVSFFFGNMFEGKLCLVNAIVTFYFFLAAFSWMLTMSFDVWRTLKLATKELRVSSGQQWRKFFIYSFCSWVLPAKIVLIAVLVELCPIGIVDDRFKPHFGQGACWFGSGPSIMVFFGLPVFLILVCNLSFFVSCTFMIYSANSMTRYSASPATKRDFRLYARLALIMGMSWIIGLVAGFVDNEMLWAAFILCNTSIGLFVFVAFTCRKKVLRALKNLGRDKAGLNMPAFSWSVNGSDDSKLPNHSDKHTTNTYY